MVSAAFMPVSVNALTSVGDVGEVIKASTAARAWLSAAALMSDRCCSLPTCTPTSASAMARSFWAFRRSGVFSAVKATKLAADDMFDVAFVTAVMHFVAAPVLGVIRGDKMELRAHAV